MRENVMMNRGKQYTHRRVIKESGHTWRTQLKRIITNKTGEAKQNITCTRHETQRKTGSNTDTDTHTQKLKTKTCEVDTGTGNMHRDVYKLGRQRDETQRDERGNRKGENTGPGLQKQSVFCVLSLWDRTQRDQVETGTWLGRKEVNKHRDTDDRILRWDRDRLETNGNKDKTRTKSLK